MFISKLFSIIKFIIEHPLNKSRKLRSIFRFLNWQIFSRFFIKKKVFKWIDESKLIAYPGETAITGNLYTGLLEINDMGFLLHFLHSSDVFVDVGSNSGAYTVLASKVIGAKSISIEPIKKSQNRIIEHLKINNIENLVDLHNCGIGKKEGELYFTNNKDSTNHVVLKNFDENQSLCKIKTLNSVLSQKKPYVLKIDTEGFEYNVIEGADKIFRRGDIIALIIELNGSGKLYGFSDKDIHNKLLSYGYTPIEYNPFLRIIKKNEMIKFNSGNVIYVKDIELTKNRCNTSIKRAIHAAHNIKL